MTRDRLWRFQQRYAPYLFLLPFFLLFAGFMLFPLVRSVWLSFRHASPQREVGAFIGLANYRELLQDRAFWAAALNTVVFTAAHLLIHIPAALGLALLLNSRVVRWRPLFRFAFFSTYLVGPVFVAVLFAVFFSRYGFVNRLLLRLFPQAPPVEWLSSPELAMPVVLIAALWLSIGFGMVYLLAALQAVDHEQYEAAAVDGAGRWSQFWHVTLPGIRPVLVFLVLVDTIGGLQLFELPYVLFQGPGPGGRGITIVMYLFVWFQIDLGYASAIGWLLVILISVVAAVQLRVTGLMKETHR